MKIETKAFFILVMSLFPCILLPSQSNNVEGVPHAINLDDMSADEFVRAFTSIQERGSSSFYNKCCMRVLCCRLLPMNPDNIVNCIKCDTCENRTKSINNIMCCIPRTCLQICCCSCVESCKYRHIATRSFVQADMRIIETYAITGSISPSAIVPFYENVVLASSFVSPLEGIEKTNISAIKIQALQRGFIVRQKLKIK